MERRTRGVIAALFIFLFFSFIIGTIYSPPAYAPIKVNKYTIPAGGDLLADGSIPLTANWDVGSYNLTASGFNADADGFFYKGLNYTLNIIDDHSTYYESGDEATFAGTTVGWVKLGAVNRTSWPSGGGIANIQFSFFDYMVFKNATSTYMVDGTTWDILDNDADDSTVCNWALGNCSGSGLRKEIVVFVGNFDIDTVLYVDDHTYLDMRAATFELTSDAVAIFRNEDVGASNDNSDITFYGGILDGNRATRTQGSGIDGCFLDTQIIDMEVREFYDYGMRFRTFSGTQKTKRLTMSRCRISGNAENEENRLGGLYFSNDGAGANDNFLSKLMMINNGGFAIKIENAGTDFRIEQFHIVGHPDEGGWPQGKGIWIEGDCDRIQIQDGHFENVDMETIHIEPGGGHFSDAHIISGNTFKSCSAKVDDDTYDIIYLDGTAGNIRWVNISDNTIIRYAPDTANEARYAIHLDGAASVTNNVVDGNAISTGAWATGAIQNDAGVANTIGDNDT